MNHCGVGFEKFSLTKIRFFFVMLIAHQKPILFHKAVQNTTEQICRCCKNVKIPILIN
jgi:hypothetical protein